MTWPNSAEEVEWVTFKRLHPKGTKIMVRRDTITVVVVSEEGTKVLHHYSDLVDHDFETACALARGEKVPARKKK